MKTLLVGIDAACGSVLEPLRDAGAVPNLDELLDGGSWSDLASQIPPWTASAWPSLYTGVNPGTHGVFGFLAFDGYDWDVVNRTHVREFAIWELLDREGYSSVVVNVPVTAPPTAFDGAIVPGYVAPERPACHPEGLLEELREAIGEYRVYPRRSATGEELVDDLRELVGMRGRAFRHLVERFDPDFGFVQFQATDTVFHELPGDDGAVEAVYRAVDEQVGRVLADVDPANVLVASDHGIGPYDQYEFRPNVFLRDHGFLETRRGGRGMPAWTTTRDEQLRHGSGGTDRQEGTLARLAAAAARLGLTAERAAAVLEALSLKSFVADRVPESLARTATEQVDFERSRAYVRDAVELGVRINLEGREPDGVVPRSEYESVRQELVALLSSVTTPDGEPMFEEVAVREEHYHGPAVDDAVDVVTVPAGFEHALSSRVSGEQFGEPREPWNHKPDGVIAARGAAFDHDGSLAGADLFDVAPTVLATFDLPPHDRMDGSVLPVVPGEGAVESLPAYAGASKAPTDDREVEQRLADLGYLE